MTRTHTTRCATLLGLVLALAPAAVLMACGSDEPYAGGALAATPRTEATEATETGEPEPTRQGIFGIASQPAAEPEATDESRLTATISPLPNIGLTFAKTDRDALVALYNATGGQNWNNYDNWSSEAPLGEWYGVTTDDNGRVVHLDLRSNWLEGEIPSELGILTSLEFLELGFNGLEGEIPPELGGLSNLEFLNLSGNQLTGEIPLELGSLANMTELYLSANRLSGEIPPELGGLANLTFLGLPANGLEGEIPPELGNLTSLEDLDLGANGLEGEIPPELGNLGNLSELNLQGNQLSGEIPPELGNLASLNVLYLSANKLSGEIPPELGNFTSLGVLDLSANKLSGEIPPELGNLAGQSTAEPEARETEEPEPTREGIFGIGRQPAADSEATEAPRLTATKCPTLAIGPTSAATDREALVALYNATDGPNWDDDDNWVSEAPLGEWYGVTTNDDGRVTSLDLSRHRLSGSRNQLSGEIPPELGSLANLISLNLSRNQLSGDIPPELGSLANLRTLRLDDNQLRREIPAELCNLASLRELRLDDNQLSGDIPPELGSLANLRTLRLEANELSGEIPPELGNLANLRVLDLTRNQLSGEIPPELQTVLADLWVYYDEDPIFDGNQISGCISDYLHDSYPRYRRLPVSVCTVEDHPSDKEMLIALYNATDGPNWNDSENWLSREPIGEWEDVSVDANGRVVALGPSKNNLTGEIPPELGNLASLRELDLGYSKLSGEIPPELGNLANLRVLNLEANHQLSGEIPPELGNLANPRILVIHGPVSGEIPLELGNLTNLKYLSLAYDQLSGCLPSSLEDQLASNSELGGLPFC